MDFIIAWVDGAEPHWKNQYLKYKTEESFSTTLSRYRDWENLKYWFRGVEKFTPWVNKIHFVTCGHLPVWLNRQHPKLNIVKHEDYIPKKYLPTFNSRTIELNYHRIKELSESYVLFNDDVFLLDYLSPDEFFKAGKICDMGVFDVITGTREYDFTILSNIRLTTKYFSKSNTIRQQPFNWFNPKYGLWYNFRNLCLFPINRYGHPSFKEFHLAQPANKSTLKELWNLEFETMDAACMPKFRNLHSVNHYVQRYHDLARNNFSPIDMRKRGNYFRMTKDINSDEVELFIQQRSKPMVCLNDYSNLKGEQFEKVKMQINRAFENILPRKSAFEN